MFHFFGHYASLFGICGVVRAGSSEGLHRGLHASQSEALAANTLFEEAAGAVSGAKRIWGLAKFGIASSAILQEIFFFESGHSLNYPWLLCIYRAFVFFFTFFFGMLLCLYSFSYDFSTLVSCVTEPHGFTRGRSLSVLASRFSHSLVPPCLSVAQLWGFGHQVYAIPLVNLPHRCLLHSH